MKIKTLLENTCDLQSVKILTKCGTELYDGLVKDIELPNYNTFELLWSRRLQNLDVDFFTAENSTLIIYTYKENTIL